MEDKGFFHKFVPSTVYFTTSPIHLTRYMPLILMVTCHIGGCGNGRGSGCVSSCNMLLDWKVALIIRHNNGCVANTGNGCGCGSWSGGGCGSWCGSGCGSGHGCGVGLTKATFWVFTSVSWSGRYWKMANSHYRATPPDTTSKWNFVRIKIIYVS